jgi:hypothetical protein
MTWIPDQAGILAVRNRSQLILELTMMESQLYGLLLLVLLFNRGLDLIHRKLTLDPDPRERGWWESCRTAS